jgi:hypothetical protein
MGPQSEGGPYAEGSHHGPPSHSDDAGRYHSELNMAMQDLHLQRPNGAYSSEDRMPSPAGSASGRDREGPRDGNRKTSGERTRSRTRNNRTGSGSLRVCKKCGEPLTGQFVRALGGTFHLDCFRCRVCSLHFTVPIFVSACSDSDVHRTVVK